MTGMEATNARTGLDLAALADQCVQCGLCLPACPTYAATREEGESPRGRIALIKGLAQRRLAATPAARDHLDRCLSCRQCEAVCPAGVRYGALIDGVRALPLLRDARPRWRGWLERALANPGWRRVLLMLRPLLAPLRGRWRSTRFPALQRLWALASLPAPARGASEAAISPATDTAGATLGLFRGCVADPYEQPLRQAIQQLLAALGESVVDLGPGLCCGSLARHGGDPATADRLAGQVRARCADRGIRHVLGTATGCQDGLARALAGGPVEALEATVYLAAHPRLAQLPLRPGPQRIAVHAPCSQRQLGAASAAAVATLLARIPDVNLLPLPMSGLCCGGAGSQFLAHPAQAVELRERLLAALLPWAADVVVSGNIGCRLQLAAGLRARGSTIEILHPLELLARQLPP